MAGQELDRPIGCGWEPGWLWRVLLIVAGILLFLLFIWLALQEFGKMVGGDPNEQIQRANKLFTLSYITSFLVLLGAGFFCPYGLLGLPVTAGLAAVLIRRPICHCPTGQSSCLRCPGAGQTNPCSAPGTWGRCPAPTFRITRILCHRA